MSDSTLDCLFQQTDERPALISATHSLSRGDLARIGRQIDQLLATAPVQRGDRVALVYPAGLDAAVVSLAVARRRECAPLNPAYTVAECEPPLSVLRSRTHS